jgi:hypothetical protein
LLEGHAAQIPLVRISRVATLEASHTINGNNFPRSTPPDPAGNRLNGGVTTGLDN